APLSENAARPNCIGEMSASLFGFMTAVGQNRPFGHQSGNVGKAPKSRHMGDQSAMSGKCQKRALEGMPERKITAGRASGGLHVNGNALDKDGSQDHCAKDASGAPKWRSGFA